MIGTKSKVAALSSTTDLSNQNSQNCPRLVSDQVRIRTAFPHLMAYFVSRWTSSEFRVSDVRQDGDHHSIRADQRDSKLVRQMFVPHGRFTGSVVPSECDGKWFLGLLLSVQDVFNGILQGFHLAILNLPFTNIPCSRFPSSSRMS